MSSQGAQFYSEEFGLYPEGHWTANTFYHLLLLVQNFSKISNTYLFTYSVPKCNAMLITKHMPKIEMFKRPRLKITIAGISDIVPSLQWITLRIPRIFIPHFKITTTNMESKQHDLIYTSQNLWGTQGKNRRTKPQSFRVTCPSHAASYSIERTRPHTEDLDHYSSHYLTLPILSFTPHHNFCKVKSLWTRDSCVSNYVILSCFTRI